MSRSEGGGATVDIAAHYALARAERSASGLAGWTAAGSAAVRANTASEPLAVQPSSRRRYASRETRC